MRWLRLRILEELSPFGLLVAGLAVGSAGMPFIKKGLRTMAYVAAKGAITAAGQVKSTGEKLRQEWDQIVSEAEARGGEQKADIRTGLREAGLGVVRAGIGLTEQTKEKMEEMKDEWKEMAEEVRLDQKSAKAKRVAATPLEPTAAMADGQVRQKSEVSADEDI
jgi:hypothetical protein